MGASTLQHSAFSTKQRFCVLNLFWPKEGWVWCQSGSNSRSYSTPLRCSSPKTHTYTRKKRKYSGLSLVRPIKNISPNFYLGRIWMFPVWLRNVQICLSLTDVLPLEVYPLGLPLGLLEGSRWRDKIDRGVEEYTDLEEHWARDWIAESLYVHLKLM